jgi:UDP-glucuronate 4-epimerase
MKYGRYLVTGGAGFIGSHVVDQLLKQNAERVVTVDSFQDFYAEKIKRANISDHLRHENYRLVDIDIRDSASLANLFAEESFDAIIHLAARAGIRPSLVQPVEYYETNVTGTLNLLELARIHEIPRFIFASSSSVYGAGVEPPFQEDAILRPISPYAATKAAGELLAHTYSHLYGINIVCLRFFTVYGARQRPDLAIHKFTKLINEGHSIPLYGNGDTERDYTYIDDIVRGVLATLSYDVTPFEIINLGESQTVSLRQLVALLEQELGRKANIEWHPIQPGDLLRTHADISKARKLLNYNPQVSIEVGLKKFVDWHLKHESD